MAQKNQQENKEFLLVQRILHVRTGETIDLSPLKSCTFVETMDMSGPRLMLELDDTDSFIADSMGLREKDVLRVTLADSYVRDGMLDVLDFTVGFVRVQGDAIRIECLASSVHCLKIPAKTSRIYTKKPMSFVLRSLVPELKQDFAKSPVVESYHLLSGERPSYMLKQMAIEQGGHIFQRRDTVCFKRLDELMAGSSDMTYEHNNPRSPNTIISYTVPNAQALMEDKVVRSYSGWNITEGWVKSAVGTDAPPELYPSPSKRTLDNLTKVPRPVLDFMCQGNGLLSAGAVLDIVWHKVQASSPIDESLPSRAVVWTVAHSYSANKYFCRVKAVVPLEQQ